MFRRQSTIPCFFCNSSVPFPANPKAFLCPACACWNRYDASGEILSDEPAMHDQSLNSSSFAKRASPSKDRLPSAYGSGPFCHTCQTNQMLLINLLANYLPAPDSPQYAHRLQMLPAYRESLHARYPPVCQDCLPAVEDEIKSKDSMARTRALGAWLSQTKGKERIRRVSAGRERDRASKQLVLWRLRGVLWAATHLVALASYACGAWGCAAPSLWDSILPLLPFLCVFSLLWAAWDPTYASFHKAQMQGRDVRVRGKNYYIALQMTTWTARLATSLASRPTRAYYTLLLALNLAILAASHSVLRLQQPPAITLIDTKSHSRSASRSVSHSRSATPAVAADADLLAALSLSSKPVITPTPTHPVFGLPSLPTPQPPKAPQADAPMDEDDNGDEMDWTPTHPSSTRPHTRHSLLPPDDDGSWLRPQRFFAPEKPTGLEGLFERTRLVDEDDASRQGPSWSVFRILSRWKWWCMLGMVCVPLVMAGVYRYQLVHARVADVGRASLPAGYEL